MLTYPEIDPVLLSLGPLKIQWYGMMYLLGFVLAFLLARHRSRRDDSPVTSAQVEDLIFYGALGIIIGGRCGYVFFYGFDQWLQNPLWLFKIWEGGMSFHGGLLGVMLAMWLYARKINSDFVSVMDFVAPLVPIGLGLGRLGNFINQELWGRASEASWAIVFPADPLGFPRHPSQLYQFLLEGVVLFVILFWFSQKPRPRYAVSALFLLCYGLFRFVVEFVREPDNHLGFVMLDWMTRGQQLCIPMIIAGVVLLIIAYRKPTVLRRA
jgi:phosphatidylglycerol:prolipoprotein diacylglycerol transferase